MRRRTALRPSKKSVFGTYVRNFIFGTEDSLVSTVGMVSGVAAAGTPRDTIILSGIVLVIVEAFSMGVGTFLSEQSEEEYLTHREGSLRQSVTNGIIMFLSYVLAGIIPMSPYFFIADSQAILFSVFASVAALAVLGAISGILFRISLFKNSLRMSVLGGLAIAVGIFVGQLVK